MTTEATEGDAPQFSAGDYVPLAAMLLKSRRWRDGERSASRCAANDMACENRK